MLIKARPLPSRDTSDILENPGSPLVHFLFTYLPLVRSQRNGEFLRGALWNLFLRLTRLVYCSEGGRTVLQALRPQSGADSRPGVLEIDELGARGYSASAYQSSHV